MVDPTVTAYGDITNLTKRFCTIKDEHGDVLKLYISKDAKIASGYIPQIDDNVKITYDKDKMWLLSIQLINRPDPDPDSDYDEVVKQTAPKGGQSTPSGEGDDQQPDPQQDDTGESGNE